MQENAVRDFAEKSAARAKDTTKVLEQTYSAASQGSAEFSQHLLEIAQANMNAAFDFARQLTRVTSPAEFFQLSAAQVQKQFQTLTEQTKQLTSHAQKVATESAQPLQSGVAKTFNKNA